MVAYTIACESPTVHPTRFIPCGIPEVMGRVPERLADSSCV